MSELAFSSFSPSSILNRLPTMRISSTPTSKPDEVLITSQKEHIEELVQEAQILKRDKKLLQDQVDTSRKEWKAERKEWADGCDSLMACHRVAHLRTNVLLAQERVALAHEREVARRERLAVIQRDFNLTLFQTREKELEIETDQLKEELRNASDGNLALVEELRGKLAEGVQELKEKVALLQAAEKAKADAERQATLKHSEHSAIESQLASARTNVDRLTLHLEDAQRNLAEKERVNSELQQEKAALKVQVEKWKSLDNRGGAEVEELRKQCATLESHIKKLESNINEEQEKAAAQEKALAKERKKVEKLQTALEEQARIAEESKSSQDSGPEDSKANKKLEKLSAALEEQAPVQEKTAKAEEEASLLEEQAQHYKSELDKALKQIERLKANSQSTAPASASPTRNDRTPDIVEAVVDDSGSEPSVVEKNPPIKAPSSKKASASGPGDTKKKPVKKPDRSKEAPKSKPAPSTGKNKRKATSDTDDDEAATTKVRRKASTSDSQPKAAKPTKPKDKKTRKSHEEPEAVPMDVDEEAITVPKKRKMKKLTQNLPFQSAQNTSIDWANFNMGDGSLNIPTELSPVKVPARSLGGKSSSAAFWKS
ncbi:hypothetical protein BC834DRAFT_844065 [Gloeopeniophorella convolvens]|nr:hypothetical protein BC834DRAFT_844065 [Gloeopeniophorella convolvens]